jgi:hypothetical protein
VEEGMPGAGSALLDAVRGVPADELQFMVLKKSQLPVDFAGFDLMHAGELDNETMAKNGFGKRTASQLREMGRVTGWVCEFAVPPGAPTLKDEPAEIVMAATVVHLFDTEDQVKYWIDEIFIKEFRDHVGEETDTGQKLQGAELLSIEGLHDYAAGLLAVHETGESILASTIVDFRVGRLLGVAYVVAKRDVTLLDLAKELARGLEQQMVRVALGSA